MTCPAGPQTGHATNGTTIRGGLPDGFEGFGFNSVKQVESDIPHHPESDKQNADAQNHPDDGVPKRMTGDAPCHADQNGQTGKPVDPRMLSIGHQRNGTGFPARANPERRYRLIREESCQARKSHPSRMLKDLGMKKLFARPDERHSCRKEDQPDNENTGQILELSISVGIAETRSLCGQRESEPQRETRQTVSDVVKRVGKKRNAPGKNCNASLKSGCRCQHQEGNDKNGGCLSPRVSRTVRVNVASMMGMLSQPVEQRHISLRALLSGRD